VKLVAWLAGLASAITAGGYMVVSLNRWEWNRALFFGLILLMAEVGLATGLVLRKLDRISALVERSRPVDPAVTGILQDTRPAAPDRFAWLRESTQRTNVFITFLVGGGVLLSGVAWLVDRIASRTSTPQREERLVRLLAPISYPAAGLLVDDATALTQDVPGRDDEHLRRLLRGI
jgi:hypothetical protein